MAAAVSKKSIQLVVGMSIISPIIAGTRARTVCAWKRGNMPANAPAAIKRVVSRLWLAGVCFCFFFGGCSSRRMLNASGIPNRNDLCGSSRALMLFKKLNPPTSVLPE